MHVIAALTLVAMVVQWLLPVITCSSSRMFSSLTQLPSLSLYLPQTATKLRAQVKIGH
jgi:hypothetical protein